MEGHILAQAELVGIYQRLLNLKKTDV